MHQKLYAGIDIGSSATKVVLIDSNAKIVAMQLYKSGMDFSAAGQNAFDAALKQAFAKSQDVEYIVSSGYGRNNIKFSNSTKTELACHSKGAYESFKCAATVLDIGGQDNKVINIDANGHRTNFKMNRKCAAGTGSFLEEMALRMNVSMEEMEPLARQSTEVVEIGSFCTVFAATEILSLVRKGVKAPDIAMGAFRSVVKRVLEMDSFNEEVIATGGVVAFNPIVVELLSELIGREVKVPPNPQFSGAIGAALYAIDECR